MIGRLLLSACAPIPRKYAGKATVFALTYIAYGLVTAARLPYSIAKTSLLPGEDKVSHPGWAPFTGSDGQELLGMLDTIFMFGYAGAMPFFGAIADRSHQPTFLGFGLCAVGAMLFLVGMAKAWDIHVYFYFAVFTFLGGCFQSIAYPCVIAVISKWFGKSKIGFILGVWSSCTPMGTIFGKLACTAAARTGWSMIFIMPGMVTVVIGLAVGIFLVDDPYSVKLLRPSEARILAEAADRGPGDAQPSEAQLQEMAARRAEEAAEEEAVPLATILRIPGMIAYCSACFFSKLSYYAFVFWLPLYLAKGLGYDETKAGNVSTLFDWGGFAGGIIGGIIIDKLKLRGVVLLSFQTCAVFFLTLYMILGSRKALTDGVNYVMLVCLGFTVTTTYSLITSVMASDLSRHPYLRGNMRAAATVTALLDGVGSFGAVLQGLIMGWISNKFGWNATFVMLMVFAAFSALCLWNPSMKELQERRLRAPSRGLSLQEAAVTSLQGNAAFPSEDAATQA